MRSRSCARKTHSPICCDTNFRSLRRYAKTGMHFYRNKNAHLLQELFSLCRKNIVARKYCLVNKKKIPEQVYAFRIEMLSCATLSARCYPIMGQNMGQRKVSRFRGNHFALKVKKSSENRVVFGTFLVAEAGLEPTTSGL